MASANVPPFDVMLGYWAGTANFYNTDGEYVTSSPSRVAVYWGTPYTRIHFRTDPPSFAEPALIGGPPLLALLTSFLDLEFDLDIVGKKGSGGTMETAVTGIESSPDVYHFILANSSAETAWHNTHRFISPDERRITGPGLLRGQMGTFVTQNFTRLTYDVPKSYIRDRRQ